ncbi:hypothetical protein QUF55_08715, partial [Clostridiaceae bacterium HSG29]|nr:hypothetical protein [Clostridiaceae bacterium HSG29]
MGCEVLNVCNIKTETIKFDKKNDFTKKDNDFKKTFESVKKNDNESNKKNEPLKKNEVKEEKTVNNEVKDHKVDVKNDENKIKFSEENKKSEITNEEMDKLKELLESLGLDVTDEMLMELSSKFDLSDINQMIDLISFINSETLETPDFENVLDSLKD